ncbi:thiopurine S-methyltransferase-like isoform X2 [Hyperolius riggenbachi]|uniref:thiopurine S-methyltransferase-like isoform X2 n=1 Tax=Hyperolius riggenbachi TaxID=752182 RepID=UPI0035A39717
MSDCPDSVGTKQNKVITEEDWRKSWVARKIGFHNADIHKLLSEFLGEMINGREKLNILFPLCGKAVDMKWLADMGHNIVGVDVSEMAIKEFFEEQDVLYVEEAVESLPDAKLFKSTCGNISLYCCSIYDLSTSLLGKFDGIWDRGALVAVNPSDRERYVNVLLPLLKKDGRHLIVTVEYDASIHPGPPFYVPDSDIERLFGMHLTLCNIS